MQERSTVKIIGREIDGVLVRREPAVEGADPVFIPIGCFPCVFEPQGKVVCKDFVRAMIDEVWGSLYYQATKIDPSIGLVICKCRNLNSLSALLVLICKEFHPTLLKSIRTRIAKIIYLGYTKWTKTQMFFPNGSMYVAWLVGKLLNVQDENPNFVFLAETLEQKLLLTTDLCCA